MITTKVQKIGKSSLALIIPSEIAKRLRIKKGNTMRITETKKCIIYEKLKKVKK